MSPHALLLAAVCGSGVPLFAPSASAQAAPAANSWALAGEFAGAIGGTWLESSGAPQVRSTTGAQLSLTASRATSPRVALGAAIRVSAQPLQLEEVGSTWSGGTLTNGQLMGVVALDLPRGGAVASALEVGGGLAMLSGAKDLAPFSTASRVAPSGEIGVSFRRAPSAVLDVRRTAFDLRALALVVRYDVTRFDPGNSAHSGAVPRSVVAGWVGRVTVGARVMK